MVQVYVKFNDGSVISEYKRDFNDVKSILEEHDPATIDEIEAFKVNPRDMRQGKIK